MAQTVCILLPAEDRVRLGAVIADHGDLVKQGEVLARLHNAEQEALVAKAKAGLINTQAALKVAKAAVEKAKAVLAQRKQSNRRKRALLARQVVSAEVADEAQMEEDVGGTVWTVEDEELRRRKVSFGHQTLDAHLEIVEGLPPAALVVTELKPGLREGRAAKVIEGETP
jgi:multidrug resistance efflux pump